MFFKTIYAFARHLLRRLLRIVDRDELIRELQAEIIVLRHRLAVETRGASRPKFHRRDRLFFAAFSRMLPRRRWGAFGFSPKTLLRWHRELVAAKWTFKPNRMGRRPIDAELAALIISMAKNSSDWGCYRVKGELQGLGYRVGVSTIRRILRRAGVPPAPRDVEPTSGVLPANRWVWVIKLKGKFPVEGTCESGAPQPCPTHVRSAKVIVDDVTGKLVMERL